MTHDGDKVSRLAEHRDRTRTREPSPIWSAVLGGLLCALASACSAGAPAHAAPATAPPPVAAKTADLLAAFARAEREADGHLGVAVLHVESGERASYHGSERFPMQSVFKLPVAIEVLARVDAGDLRLDEMIHVRPIDLRPGPGGSLADELGPEGGDRTARALLERMLLASDNTAVDTLLERLGGPRRVTERLRSLGLLGIDVSRSEAELMLDFRGVSPLPPREAWTFSAIQELSRTSPATRTKALAAYAADPRDTATPESMAALLLRVHRQDLLGKSSAALLVSLLEQTTTGKARLKGALPPGTTIAHRTGTSDTTDGITAATNDVGIITLPGGAGHVIVAAFLTAARGDDDARERALAQVGRAVFDRYAPR